MIGLLFRFIFVAPAWWSTLSTSRTASNYLGDSVIKLGQLMASHREVKGPVCMIGDWNMAPHKLTSSSLLSGMGKKALSVMEAPAPFTCSIGMSTIDHMLVNGQARSIISDLQVDHEAPWRPHCGLQAMIYR